MASFLVWCITAMTRSFIGLIHTSFYSLIIYTLPLFHLHYFKYVCGTRFYIFTNFIAFHSIFSFWSNKIRKKSNSFFCRYTEIVFHLLAFCEIATYGNWFRLYINTTLLSRWLKYLSMFVSKQKKHLRDQMIGYLFNSHYTWTEFNPW